MAEIALANTKQIKSYHSLNMKVNDNRALYFGGRTMNFLRRNVFIVWVYSQEHPLQWCPNTESESAVGHWKTCAWRSNRLDTGMLKISRRNLK